MSQARKRQHGMLVRGGGGCLKMEFESNELWIIGAMSTSLGNEQ